MKDFQVVSLTEPLIDEHIEVVLAAFAELYNSVTHKHQRRMQLNFICQSHKVATVLDFAAQHKIEAPLELIPYNAERLKDQLPLNSTALLLPSEERLGRLTREALSKDIPVVAFMNDTISEYVDQTCGVFVRNRGFGFNVESFAKTLRMLYFDPEVRKLMHRGARAKYLQISGGAITKKLPTPYARSYAGGM